MNPALLSPSSFTDSMPSITSWGTLTVVNCDLAFLLVVAITETPQIWCVSVYTKKKYKKGLTCVSLQNNMKHTNGFIEIQTTKPGSALTLTGLLTTNDRKRIEVAMLNHTTHPQGRDSHNLNKPDVKNLLIATASQGYDLPAPAKSGAGIGVLVFNEAHNTRPACFFVPDSHTLSMVGCMGAEQSAPGSSLTGYANPVQSTASEIGVSCGGFIKPNEEAANMATIPTLVHSQTAFIWRFIIFGASESQIIHVTAWTEREARNHCPSGCVAVFAARIRQGVRHVQ
ncbi:host cell division inhibitor Icd-like protein [Escherichia coli]|uniref:host cell division inhibitor Icd-like protein n=3 Tax=Escherichia coli TaxID=562 RepID=UPI003C2F8E2E